MVRSKLNLFPVSTTLMPGKKEILRICTSRMGGGRGLVRKPYSPRRRAPSTESTYWELGSVDDSLCYQGLNLGPGQTEKLLEDIGVVLAA